MIPALLLLASGALSAQTPPDRSVQQLKEFEKLVDDYIQLRKDATKGTPKLAPSKSPETINTRQQQLAGHIRLARAAASQGTIFTPSVATEFRARIAAVFSGKQASAVRNTLHTAVPVTTKLKVNDLYPESQPLPSTPPTLLLNLPRLPAVLDYRIIGKTLFLRDIEANLIVDYLPNAIP